MKPTLSQVCSLNSPFEQDIKDYAAGKCPAVEVWLTKLEAYLESNTTDDVRRLLDENEIAAPVASFQGGLLSSQGEARDEAWKLFTRRMDLCREIGAETIVVACDVSAPLSQQVIDRSRASLRQIADESERCGVRVAIEFQATSAFGNNLQSGLALLEEVDSPHLGVCLDAFHFYVGPSKSEDLGQLTAANLFHVQLCDIADVPRELAMDSDRILPGEGDIPLAPIIERLHAIRYQRCVSIELMNPQIWHVPPVQFGEVAITALRSLLGLASME